jgi:hypothetical protein
LAGRTELIGDGCDGLIPSKPPREAIEKRRKDANGRFRGEYVHTIPATEPEKPKAATKKPDTAAGKRSKKGGAGAGQGGGQIGVPLGGQGTGVSLEKKSKKERRQRKTTGYRPDRSGAE